MIPLLMVAYYNRPDLLERCLFSIDFPVNTLLIIDNSPDGPPQVHPHVMQVVMQNVRNIVLIRHPNAGWAGSCNEAIKLFPQEPWRLLVNNDIQFAPGDLQKMHDAAFDECNKADGAAALFGNHGSSWWAITHRGVEQVGLLDENFFPCYLDDCDWCYRAKLAGARLVTVPGCQSRHGDERVSGSCTIHSDEELRKKNYGTHGRLYGYYREKWGGDNDHEVFKHPFNNPNWPVQFWIYRPQFRRGQQWS